MQATQQELSALGRVFTQKVDVSNSQEVENAGVLTHQACGYVDIVINCAGIVANNKPFYQQNAIEHPDQIDSSHHRPFYLLVSHLNI